MLRQRRPVIRWFALCSLFVALAACTRKPDHLTYDGSGVAQDVLALIPHNTEWARTVQYDAVLYRVELRADPAGDGAPTDALYSFYSPGSQVFLTATSDPRTPWEGAEPQDWPVARRPPMPLPPVAIDFAAAWTQARNAGITRVSSAVLEVNQRNALPIVAWTITGSTRDPREQGIYIDALTGDRLYQHTLAEPPVSPASLETAQSRYRGALRAGTRGSGGCAAKSFPVPATDAVVCYEPVRRIYSSMP
ncbi:MAG: hypothetical protein V4813_12360 [Gemmatimonadota bacterium]